MKIIVDISTDLEGKISELVRSGTFRNINHFVDIACRNQVMAEEGEIAWEATPGLITPVSASEPSTEKRHLARIHALIQIPSRETYASAPSGKEVVAYADQPFWGQLYRYLPMKVGLRVLANLCKDGPVELGLFHETAGATARRFRLHLADLDRRFEKKVGEKLATSFPTNTKESLKRYTSQFLADARPDSRVTGLMARLFFASVEMRDGECFVSPTQAGLRFARLSNPVIDDNDVSKILSQEESDFILNMLAQEVGAEYDHVVELLMFLRDGPISGDELNDRMREFYSAFQDDESTWSDAMINTMRSGATSRLSEMGLMSRTQPKRGSPFVLTEMGTRWLNLRNTAKVRRKRQ